MRSTTRPQVAVIQPYITSYRVPLFTELAERLGDAGVDLRLVAARPKGAQARRGDEAHLEGARRVRSLGPVDGLPPLRLKMLPLGRLARADLIVGELAAGCVDSLLLAACTQRFAVWGHAYGAVAESSPLDQRVEAWLMRRARHVFTYTDRGRDSALSNGIPDKRITVLHNTIDTRSLARAVERVDADGLAAFRATHGLGPGPVLAYVGGLDDTKRLDLLLDSTRAVVAQIPDAHLLVAGDGASRQQIEDFCRAHPWAHYLGRVDDSQKALIAATSSLLLNPGRVGLIALDSFAMGTPLATTRWPFHAPEFDYLDADNALITPDEPETYVREVVETLRSPERLDALRQGCRRGLEQFSIEAMAKRFAAGALTALRAFPPAVPLAAPPRLSPQVGRRPEPRTRAPR